MPSLAHTFMKTGRDNQSLSMFAGMLAAAWGVIFAIPHILWGMGWFRESLRFSLGIRPGPGEERMIRDPVFIATGLWGVAGLCLMATVIALSTSQPWGQRLPRWVPIIGAWGVCIVLAIRGLFMPGIIGGLAVEAGFIPIGENSDPAWNRWNIVLWSPWFLVGAFLFARAALDVAARNPAQSREKIE